MEFLSKKDGERKELDKKRKVEILRRQEEQAFQLRLQRERDRMLALQIKKQG